MQRRIQLFGGTVLLALATPSAVDAQLPNVAGSASSRLQNRAAIRVPGVDASQAARIRAGANFDPSRIRANAAANGGVSAAVGSAARLRASSSTRAALEARRRNSARNRQPTPDQTLQADSHTRPRSGLQLQTSGEFRTRLAEIERMRDTAAERGDITLLQRADRLEQDLRARQLEAHTRGRAQASADSSTDTSHQNDLRHRSQAAIHAGQQAHGQVRQQVQNGRRQSVRTAEHVRQRAGSTLNGTRVSGRAGASAASRANLRGPASGHVNQRTRAGASAEASPGQINAQGNTSSQVNGGVQALPNNQP